MKKIIILLAVITLVLAVSGTIAIAGDGVPSSKTVAVSEEAQIVTEPGWTPILSTTIRTSEKSDLVISVSVESLLVSTESINETAPSGMSNTSLQIAVWIDDIMARPGTVTLNQETHYLDSSTIPVDAWLRTQDWHTSSNTFNFVAVNVGPGVHTITAETLPNAYGSPSEPPNLIGYGIFKKSMVIDQVQMTKPTQAAITLTSQSVQAGNLTVNGFMWIGDYKSVEVSLEYWVGSILPPESPNTLGPIVMTADGEFSFGPFLPIASGVINWYRAKVSYNGIDSYTSIRGIIP